MSHAEKHLPNMIAELQRFAHSDRFDGIYSGSGKHTKKAIRRLQRATAVENLRPATNELPSNVIRTNNPHRQKDLSQRRLEEITGLNKIQKIFPRNENIERRIVYLQSLLEKD